MPKSKSCKKGYSRNKSTGRCRKIRKSVKSKRKCRSKKYLKLTKISKRISKKIKNLSKKMSKAAKNCRTRRKSRKSAGRTNKKYQVAVEYYAPPNFKKSKLAKLDTILESVIDEDDSGNEYYFYLVRVQAANRTNLLKYLKDIGNMKKILEIDDL